MVLLDVAAELDFAARIFLDVRRLELLQSRLRRIPTRRQVGLAPRLYQLLLCYVLTFLSRAVQNGSHLKILRFFHLFFILFYENLFFC